MLIDHTRIRLLEEFALESEPLAQTIYLELPKPSLRDPMGDADRTLMAAPASLSAKTQATGKLSISLDALRRLSRTLRESAFRVTAVLAQRGDGCEVIDARAGDDGRCFGLALDIGTTIVTLYLVDMAAGEIAAKAIVENPQIEHGEDILTRIHFCRREGGLRELQDSIISRLNESAAELARAAGLRASDLCAAAVAGNPAMTHILLGVDPYHLCREPYVPVFNLPLELRAKDVGLSIVPEALVYVFPNLGSYFGGDVVAGILASGMHEREKPSILVDVGTNAEIVLGNRDWLVACAGAAGPALESGGAKAGMRAVGGAITNVRIDRQTLEPVYEVIGGGPPRGVCGSGLIELVAELYLSGALDSKGRIAQKIDSPRILMSGDARAYALALASRGESAGDIMIDEHDILNLLRAKGAMYTALTLITKRLGVDFHELESFYVAGSFGEHIDPRSAVTIGMLPDIPLERYRVLGNSAGLGACLLLISSGLRRMVEDIHRKAVYIQLTTDNEFMSGLSAALFIPHTDKNLFPSVKK